VYFIRSDIVHSIILNAQDSYITQETRKDKLSCKMQWCAFFILTCLNRYCTFVYVYKLRYTNIRYISGFEAAILNIPILVEWHSTLTSHIALLDTENIVVAVENSLLSCL